MTDNQRTLFLQVESGEWTAEELGKLTESVAATIPDDVGVVATPDDVEYMTEEQVRDMAETILDALDGE